MALRLNRWRALPVALTAVLMAGCGAQPAPTGVPDARTELHVMAQDAATVPPGHGKKFLAQLGLTAGQKARLKEIKADMPKLDKAQFKGWTSTFRTLVKADPVDQAALTSLITDVFTTLNSLSTKKIDLVGKARDVLTVDQRKQVAVAILAHVGAVGDEHEDHADLNLTASQKAAFEWMKAYTKPKLLAALASYMLTGDKAALTQAWTFPDVATHSQAMSAAIASMTPKQRKRLLVHMDRAHARMHAHDETTSSL